jgi:hypothetical protein
MQLNRLRAGLQAVLVIGAILSAEALFVHFTHALYIQAHSAALAPAEAARIAAADHELLVLAMLLGAAVSLLVLPVPMIAALALGIAIGGYRIPALTSFAVVVAIGTYGRRFGPRGSIAMMLFVGDFSGYLLHTVLTLDDLGWLVAEIELATVAAIAVRFVFFYPRPPGRCGAPSAHMRPGSARWPLWRSGCPTAPGTPNEMPVHCTANSYGSMRQR